MKAHYTQQIDPEVNDKINLKISSVRLTEVTFSSFEEWSHLFPVGWASFWSCCLPLPTPRKEEQTQPPPPHPTERVKSNTTKKTEKAKQPHPKGEGDTPRPKRRREEGRSSPLLLCGAPSVARWRCPNLALKTFKNRSHQIRNGFRVASTSPNKQFKNKTKATCYKTFFQDKK